MEKLLALLKNRKQTMRSARWMRTFAKPYIGQIILSISVGVAISILSLVMVTISKNIIDNATIGHPIVRLIVVYIILIIAMQGLSILDTIIETLIGEYLTFGIRKQIYEKIINSHWMDIKKHHSGDLMTRLTSDVENIASGLVYTIPGIILLIINLVMVFLTLYSYSKLLAILALLIAPVAAITSLWLGTKLGKLQKKVQETESVYRSFMQESVENMLIVKSFANEKAFVNRLAELRSNCFHWIFKKTKLNIASSTILSLAFQVGYIFAFSYGAFQISQGQITYGTMSVFLALVNRVQSPIMQLAKQIPKVVNMLTSAGRVMEIQDIPDEEKLEKTITPANIGIEVKDVSFGYIPEELVLENTSLNIKAGEFVAVIGESGIGKTTLIRLIMSFTNTYQGEIKYYNDKNEEVPANAGTREFISYVPQGNTLFSGTIRENISMGNMSATEEEMYDALKMAAAYDFVTALPDGIDTVIGERGHGLSEGQAQRIAIARAFVRKAPFLILDEATSALDEQTELKVVSELRKLDPKPTCVVITHRKSILTVCDRQILIEDKKAVEV